LIAVTSLCPSVGIAARPHEKTRVRRR
jgi:hypothetical protein